MSSGLELLAVALVVGAALSYVLIKSLRAAKTLAKGQAPSCCTDKAGYAERAVRSSCADADGVASGGGNLADADGASADGGSARGGRYNGGSAALGGFVSPCAGCAGCSQRRG